ncbi:hypothetical protein GBA52_024372 [Prunus armeniaca]|nr:hypothetical protein GBA52_024372 [Prunus armeniaca]
MATGIFYPTYLANSGMKTNIFKIHPRSLWIVGVVVIFSTLVKIGAVMLPASYFDVPLRQAFVLGLILNSKGITELVMFDLFKQSKQYAVTRRSTIQHLKRESELTILACIHNQENVPTFINVVEVSNATEQNLVAVIALVLTELVGRTNPILVSHRPYDTLDNRSSGHIVKAMRQYEQYNEGYATLQAYTSISSYVTMHDDIFRLAFEKRVNLVIMPFHKQWAIDATLGQ